MPVVIATAVAIVVAGTCLLLLLRRDRARILRLEWPERFATPKALSRHCRLYLQHNGWTITSCRGEFDYRITKLPRRGLLVIACTEKQYRSLDKNYRGTEADYNYQLPDYFLSPIRFDANRRGAHAVIIVTDFRTGAESVERCGKVNVYPVFWKDLPRLEGIVPARGAGQARHGPQHDGWG